MTTRLAIFCLSGLLLNIGALAEAPPTLARSIPAGAFAYAETNGLAELVSRARGSELYESIMASGSTQDFIASEESKQLRRGIQWAKLIMRMDLWDAAEKLLGGPAAIALYPNPNNGGKQPETLIIVRPEDPKAWSKQRIWTDPLLAISAKRIERGKAPPGVKIYETKPEGGADKSYLALHRQWVLISSDATLLKRGVLLLQTESEGESLASTGTHLKQLTSRLPGEHLARAFVDTKLLSAEAGGRLGLPEKMDNPLGSLVFGGVLELLAHNDLACMALDFEEGTFTLRTSLDAKPADLDQRFGVFFAGEEPSREIPEIPGLIGGVTMHRSLATWYQSRDDLIQEQVLPQFDKFETGIGNLLPGKDIGEDIMPLIGDNFTIVSAIQDYSYLDGEPGVKLPGFAMVFDLAQPDPQAGENMVQLFFQTFLSILNLQAAEQNRQPWLIAAQDHDGTQITYARYFQKPKGEQLPTVFNFLPAAARAGDQYVVSSSLGMCKNLIDHLKLPPEARAENDDSRGRLNFAGLARALELNRQHLVASRLNEGRDPEHAIDDIEHLFLALGQLGELETVGRADATGFHFTISGTLK
ncbi:MAG: hypothetical protein ACI8XO_003153 [Verrucomicrobiales bacterium]|jgi:hypothetical protein